MGAVVGNGYAPYKSLNVVCRAEFCLNLRTIHYLPNSIDICTNASNIHRDYDFCAFSDSRGQLVIIHLDIILLRIHKYDCRADMSRNRRRRRVGVGRDNHLIPRADSQHMKCHLHRRRSGVQADGLLRVDIFRNLLLKLLCPRSGGNPSAQDCITNLISLSLRHIWRRERR